MAKIKRKIKPVYLALGILLLVALLSTAFYFFFIKGKNKEHTRGTYVLNYEQRSFVK
ncbi:MAG: hypothetical protein GX187_02675 [Clostridiaceae bacterium]|nr:hypothetical protein [Clostridiaceae bacterium]